MKTKAMKNRRWKPAKNDQSGQVIVTASPKKRLVRYEEPFGMTNAKIEIPTNNHSVSMKTIKSLEQPNRHNGHKDNQYNWCWDGQQGPSTDWYKSRPVSDFKWHSNDWKRHYSDYSYRPATDFKWQSTVSKSNSDDVDTPMTLKVTVRNSTELMTHTPDFDSEDSRPPFKTEHFTDLRQKLDLLRKINNTGPEKEKGAPQASFILDEDDFDYELDLQKDDGPGTYKRFKGDDAQKRFIHGDYSSDEKSTVKFRTVSASGDELSADNSNYHTSGEASDHIRITSGDSKSSDPEKNRYIDAVLEAITLQIKYLSLSDDSERELRKSSKRKLEEVTDEEVTMVDEIILGQTSDGNPFQLLPKNYIKRRKIMLRGNVGLCSRTC